MSRAALIGICLVASTSPGLAVEATRDEATRLTGEFHKYLGTPAAGQADFVRVEPQGDAYKVTLDLEQFALPFHEIFRLEAAEASFVVEPLVDGTWRVSDLQLPAQMVLHVGDTTSTNRWQGVAFDAIYDPALASFTQFTQTISASDGESSGPGTEAVSHTGEQTVRSSATAAGGGSAVNMTLRQTVRDLVSHQTVTLPTTNPSSSPPAPVEFSYGVDSIDVDATIDAIEGVQLLDLWAYGVSVAQQETPTLDEQAIKARALAVLPIYQRLKETFAARGINVSTPIGEFRLADLSGDVMFPGIVDDAEMAFSLKLAGPTYPAELIPSWAKDMLPTGVEFGLVLSGLDLDAAARHAIETIHFDREPPMTDADVAATGMLALPPGATRLALNSGHIDGELISAQFEGEIVNIGPTPSGSLTVDITGLAAAITALQGETADLNAAKLLGVLSMAQMWGKHEDDGTTHFLFEVKEDGSLLLNGAVLRPPTGKTL